MELSKRVLTHGLKGTLRNVQTGEILNFNFQKGVTAIRFDVLLDDQHTTLYLVIDKKQRDQNDNSDIDISLRFTDQAPINWFTKQFSKAKTKDGKMLAPDGFPIQENEEKYFEPVEDKIEIEEEEGININSNVFSKEEIFMQNTKQEDPFAGRIAGGSIQDVKDEEEILTEEINELPVIAEVAEDESKQKKRLNRKNNR